MENITKILKEKLELENKNNTEKLEIIQEKRDEFGSCINGLDYLKDEINSEIIERRNSLRREFCKKLNEKLKDENTGWRHIQAGWTECDFNPVSLNFGFRNDNNELIYKINNKELYLHIQINDWQVFACGFSYPPEDEEMKKIITEDIQHYFKNKGINLISGNPWWRAILSSDCYTPYENIAQSFYNDEHNETFQKKMDKIVDVFFNQVKRMFEIWRQFNEEKK